MLECRDIEGLMMDWLYNELDQTDTAEFQDHLSSCSSCEEELESLKATREAFSQLPSEEPPASVSAILLHEAAKSAPAAAREPVETDSGGFWAWLVGLFQPIAAHPAAAAIASLVLVAGVAGTLYVTKGSNQVAQPELAEKASAGEERERMIPVETSATEVGDASAAASAPDLADLEAPAEPEPAAAPPKTTTADGFAADLVPKDTQGKLDSATESLRRDAKANAERRSLDHSERARVAGRRKAKRKSPPPAANAISGTDPLIDLDEGGSSDDSRRAAEKKPMNKAAGLAIENEKAGKDKTYRVYKEREQQWAKTQRKALTQAVKKEDCRRAARIANDILDRNRDYYVKNIKSSKDVNKCKWYVSDERKRRVKSREVRAQRGAKKKRKAGGVPSKAKAAPKQEADMASEAAE